MENVPQEDREAKIERNYVGNGKVVFTEGLVTAVPTEDKKPAGKKKPVVDLPF